MWLASKHRTCHCGLSVGPWEILLSVPVWDVRGGTRMALQHHDGVALIEDAEADGTLDDTGRRVYVIPRALRGRLLQGQMLQGRNSGLQSIDLVIQEYRGAETATEQEGALQQRDQLDGEVVRLGRRLAEQAELFRGPLDVDLEQLCDQCDCRRLFLAYFLPEATIRAAIPCQLVFALTLSLAPRSPLMLCMTLLVSTRRRGPGLVPVEAHMGSAA